MTKSPILWGAGLACALGGALAGNALGSITASDRSATEMFYQTHETAFADRQGGRVLPDHYPLVTRNGAVEVAQLSDRGLFSQSRYRTADLAAAYADADFGDPGPGIEETAPVPAQEFVETTAPAEPLAFAQGPSDGSGQAKIIDVQTVLAMR